jgi:hypothetical protein
MMSFRMSGQMQGTSAHDPIVASGSASQPKDQSREIKLPDSYREAGRHLIKPSGLADVFSPVNRI